MHRGALNIDPEQAHPPRHQPDRLPVAGESRWLADDRRVGGWDQPLLREPAGTTPTPLLLVGGEHQHQVTGEPRPRDLGPSEHHRRNCALHVGRAQAVEPPIAHGGLTWWGLPRRDLARRLGVGVTVQDQGGPATATRDSGDHVGPLGRRPDHLDVVDPQTAQRPHQHVGDGALIARWIG